MPRYEYSLFLFSAVITALQIWKGHMAQCKHPLGFSHCFQEYSWSPPPSLFLLLPPSSSLHPGTMETIDTVCAVWQIALSSSPTLFTLQEQRLCTHVDTHTHIYTLHKFHSCHPALTHTHTNSAHTQVITKPTQNLTWLKNSEERPVTALSFSFFSCSLCFDRAWIRTSLHKQTASVLFQVQGLNWEQIKVTHIFFTCWWWRSLLT